MLVLFVANYARTSFENLLYLGAQEEGKIFSPDFLIEDDDWDIEWWGKDDGPFPEHLNWVLAE